MLQEAIVSKSVCADRCNMATTLVRAMSHYSLFSLFQQFAGVVQSATTHERMKAAGIELLCNGSVD